MLNIYTTIGKSLNMVFEVTHETHLTYYILKMEQESTSKEESRKSHNCTIIYFERSFFYTLTDKFKWI